MKVYKSGNFNNKTNSTSTPIHVTVLGPAKGLLTTLLFVCCLFQSLCLHFFIVLIPFMHVILFFFLFSCFFEYCFCHIYIWLIITVATSI